MASCVGGVELLLALYVTNGGLVETVDEKALHLDSVHSHVRLCARVEEEEGASEAVRRCRVVLKRGTKSLAGVGRRMGLRERERERELPLCLNFDPTHDLDYGE